MNKTVLLFLLLLLLGGVAYFLSTKDKEAAYGKVRAGDRLFAVEQSDEIYKIYIAPRDRKAVTLTRNADHWIVNGQYRANQSVIESTLMALRNMELSFIPTQNAYEHIMRELATRGIKVEVYDKSDKQIRSFYVGGTSPDGKATQMIVEGYDQPYMMKLRGRDGSIRPHFEKKFDDWRDRYLFRNLSVDLDTMKLVYPDRPDESFQITRQADGFRIEPLFSTQKTFNQQPHQSVFQRYFYEIERIAAEAYKNDRKDKAQVMRSKPFASFYLRKKDGSVKEWNFIPHRVNDHEKKFDGDLFDKRVVFRYFIVDRDGDLLFGQRQLLNHIFWGYSFFFEPNKIKK